MRLAAAVALAAASVGLCAAQPAAPAAKPAEVSFQFDRPGLPVPRFTLRIRENGEAEYQAEEKGSAADGGTAQYAVAKQVDSTVKLSAATVARIFKTARELGHFDMTCESKAKNIANTGKKTLSYDGADGKGSCTYNYSANKDVDALTDTFLGIAFTMDEGRRLEFLHRYDRLGLDAEMTALQQAAESGRALELGTIAPVLTAIAGDNAVMQRVRLQAARMLEQSGSNKI
jgi:hypothetical protein